MFIALLALFVALGGSSYAAVKIKIGASDIKKGAVGTRAVADNSIRSADVRNDSLTNADIDNSNLTAKSADVAGHAADADRATTADRAASATSATNATSAVSAGNADKLDGLDSADFTRSSCASESGAIKGSVTIPANSAFSSSFTSVGGYNCSGQSVEARRLSMGRYEVRFNGSPATQAVATAIVTSIKADMVSVTNQGPGRFTVYVLDPLPAPGAFVDDAFTVVTI